MTLRETFIKYLEHRVADGRPVFASHDMGDARMWIMYKSGKMCLQDTLSRIWRECRETGTVEVRDAKLPNSREGRWFIKKINS